MLNPQEHYAKYQAAVRPDLLPGFGKFCSDMPTRNPSQWPTINSYLKHVVNSIKMSKKSRTYEQWLSVHKDTLIKVLKKIVEERLLSMEGYREKNVLDLAHNESIKYLKFSNLVLKFDKFTLIPRYTTKFVDPYDPEDGIYFDADEFDLIIKAGDQELAEKALRLKGESYNEAGSHACKIVKIFGWDERGFDSVYIDKANGPDQVKDWVLPLKMLEGFCEE